MQLDDVVSSTITGPRVEQAMWRFTYSFDIFILKSNLKAKVYKMA